VQSYRDLPLLINQWANVVRWEMRTRLFLRTAEFLWQEGHTAHATEAEAREETMRMLEVYADVRRELDGHAGHQGREDRRRGASRARSTPSRIEAHDAGPQGACRPAPAHYLGQNFAQRPASITLHCDQKARSCSTPGPRAWGVSTAPHRRRCMMTHADDDGFVIPPLAPRPTSSARWD
jgi:prolyl-tRNA synthetase